MNGRLVFIFASDLINFHTLCIDRAQPDPTIFEILRYELS
jgi:hypothetical protein